MNWLNLPAVAWDTETDSPDPTDAHIVTACIGLGEPDERIWTTRTWLLRPDRPIPAEATAVHGITTEHATEHGMDRVQAIGEIRDTLADRWAEGVPVVGHNAPFDCTVLDRELRRNGLPALVVAGPVLDTLVLFRRFDHSTGSRTLEQLAHRNGIRFPAHDAEADALTALRLLHILAGDNDLLPLVPLDALQERQRVWSEAQQQAAYWRRRGNGHNPDPDIRPWPYGPIQTIRKDAV